MISSPSAQIVNAIAEGNEIRTNQGKLAPSYGPTMGVATAIIATGIAVTTALGPEKRGRHFETVGPPVAEEVIKELEDGHIDDEKDTGAKAIEVSEKTPEKA